MKLIRLYSLIGIILFTLVVVSSAGAAEETRQQPVATLEWLTIDLWPDYDRASVLVLLTGSVSGDVSLPATVTLPLPTDATLNAVARISEDNQMIDDLEFESGGGTLTLTTPDRRFRVEYYMPYQANGLQRTFTFNWPGGPAVGQLDLSVQQPLAATSMDLQPAAESVIDGTDGLQYHNLAMRQLQAAEGFDVTVDYRLSSEQLTANSATPPESGSDTPDSDATAGNTSPMNWPVLLGVAGATMLLVAIGWQIFGAQFLARRKPRKPRPLRAMRSEGASFCHQCGAPARPGDRFCRECGTELKKSEGAS